MTVHQLIETFPATETHGLNRQMRKDTLGVSSNIEEGAARQTRKGFFQFLRMAQGSLSKWATQLEIARCLQSVNENAWRSLDGSIERVNKMLSGLIQFQRSPQVLRLTFSNPGGANGS